MQGDTELRFVLIAGEPIAEPVVQYGKCVLLHVTDTCLHRALSRCGHLHAHDLALHYLLTTVACNVSTSSGTVCNFTCSMCLLLGPFVMNTQAEINQAIRDYRTGKNGFERALTWKSSVYK